MRCNEARICISREMDGELSGDKKEAVREHIEQCVRCAAFARHCREVQRLMAGDTLPPRDEAYWAGLSGRLAHRAAHEAESSAAGLRLSRTIASLAAAACLILLVGIAVQQGRIARLRAGGSPEDFEPAQPGYAAGAVAQVASRARHVSISEQTTAFGVLADYFADGLRWMAQDGSQTELGVGADAFAGHPTAGGEPAVVDICLIRIEGEQEARIVSAPTVLILPGEEANFRLAASDGFGPKRFRYRCLTGPGTRGDVTVAVELDLQPEAGVGPVRLRGLIRSPGDQPVPIAYSRAGEAGYILFVSTPSQYETSSRDTGT